MLNMMINLIKNTIKIKMILNYVQLKILKEIIINMVKKYIWI